LLVTTIVLFAGGKAEKEKEKTVKLMSSATGDQWFKEMTEPFKGETIKVLVTSGYGFVDSIDYAGDDFTALTGVKLDVSGLPWEQMHEKVIANYIAKSGEYDVFLLDGWMGPAIFNTKAVMNLQPVIDEGRLVVPGFDFDDFIKNDWRFNGTWPMGEDKYAIPYFPDVMMLYYNKTYFDKYGIKPPQTWDEFEQIAKKINGKDFNNDGKPDYAFGVFGKKGVDLPTVWHTRFIAFGGSYFDDKLYPTLNNDPALQGLEMVLDHMELAAPGSYDWDVPLIVNAFINGDIAMAEMWGNMPSSADDPSVSKIVGEWGVVPVPQGKRRAPQYGGWSLGVSPHSANPELSFVAIQWVTSQKMMTKVNEDLHWPMSRYSVLLSPEALQRNPWYEQFVEGLDAGEALPKIPECMEIYSIVERHLSNAIHGGTAAKATLDKMQQEVLDLMEERGYY
jgi:ABC-type glycerol-3-phosphate transport system substrate-binding protein